MLRVSEIVSAIKFEKAIEQEPEQKAKACHPDVMCPTCSIPLIPEHAHAKCPKCHYRDSCCF